MENTLIIETILSRVAMMSNDGFLSGFDTQENIDLLESSLKDYGISEADIHDVMEKLVKPSETVGLKKTKTAGQTAKDPNISGENWSRGKISRTSLAAKNIPDDKIDKIINFIKAKDAARTQSDRWTSDEEKFLKNFNALSPKDAAEYVGGIYSSSTVLHDENHIVGFLDSTGLKGESSIGRGEYPLVFLIAGCQTGRGQSGDLLVGGKVIDVKESIGGVFKVEDNSFRDRGFNNLKIVKAMDELETFLKRKKENMDAMLNLMKKINEKNILDPKEFQFTESYLKNPTKESFGVNVFNGLIKCREYFKAMGDEEKIEAVTSLADFKMPDKEVEVAVDIPDKASKRTIENPPQQSTPVQINVAAIGNKEQSIIVPEILKLTMFSDSDITPEKVGKETIPQLEYDGIIIVNKQGQGPKARITWVEYIEDLTQSSGWSFYAYSKGIKFKRIGKS